MRTAYSPSAGNVLPPDLLHPIHLFTTTRYAHARFRKEKLPTVYGIGLVAAPAREATPKIAILPAPGNSERHLSTFSEPRRRLPTLALPHPPPGTLRMVLRLLEPVDPPTGRSKARLPTSRPPTGPQARRPMGLPSLQGTGRQRRTEVTFPVRSAAGYLQSSVTGRGVEGGRGRSGRGRRRGRRTRP